MVRQLTLVTFLLITIAYASTESSDCDVLAQTETGWVCGTKRLSRNDKVIASFLGIPYAKQPFGELRFKELQPAEPWDGVFNASTEGPVCPSNEANLIFGPLMQPHGVSEGCIHVNVYVPIDALPDPDGEVENVNSLQIIVFIHGGSWISGSGDPDINGPEYIVGKNVILVTFNSRQDVIGFLSMNNDKVPGNNGLRDAVTLLRWVRANARYFGGNPDDVTLAGQSAGAASAHLLTLSPASTGLFNRVWLMSGTAIQRFYTASPVYAQQVSNKLFSYLSFNTTNDDEIYDKLINTSIEDLIEASRRVLAETGITSFVPVVETPRTGITIILPDDPDVLLAEGKGSDIPIVIGFTNKECESMRPRLEAHDMVAKYEQNPLVALYSNAVYQYPSNVTTAMTEKIRQRYFGQNPTMDEYVRWCSDSLFAYPAMKLARARANAGGAPVYLYKFAYNAEYSALKEALNLTYCGAGHTEDLNNILKVNSWPVPESDADEAMKDLMSELFVNFIKSGDPSGSDVSWPPYPNNQYFYINDAQDKQHVEMSEYDQDMVEFYDNLADV